MPAGEGQERERFAAAVEQGVDALPPGDEELLRELELVALLRESRAALAPDADASARMRAKVMGAAAELLSSTPSTAKDDDAPTLVDTPAVSEPVASGDEKPSGQDEPRTNVVPIGRGRGRHRFPRTRSASHRRGQLTVTAAAALMVIAAAGGGALFSQDALPGDSLYGVKQTTESAVVGLTPGQGNKAQRQLDYAATRIDEVGKLNSGAAAAPDRGADISQALRGFNDQTAAGSRMWLSGAGAGNSAELGALTNWAQTQSQRISAMRSSMPASSQPDADHSLRLLEDLRTRAQSLSNRQGCDKVTSGDEDQLGPLPARGACDTKDVSPVAPTARSVAPPGLPAPARSGRSSESSSSEESSEDSSNSDLGESKPVKPELPGLGGLTGGDKKDVNPLPSREPTSSEKPLPDKPGLNLQLPLLPILFQPIPNGLPKPTNG